MKKTIFFALAIATLLSCNSTQDDIILDDPVVETPEEEPVEKVDDIISEGRINVPKKYLELNGTTNDFAWKVFAEILKDHKSENVVFSPFCMAVDLAMLNNGANGKTSSEITSLLGLDGKSKSSINCYFNALTEGLAQIDPTVKFASSNAIWYDQNVVMKEPFIKTLKDMYLADANAADLRSQKTVDDINKWCSEKTFGMIPTLIDNPWQLPSVFALLNATYIKAPWTEPFNKKMTHSDVFTTSECKIETEFMNANYIEIPWYKDDEMRIGFFDMGKAEKFDMFFALPAEGKSLESTFAYMKENWEELSNCQKTFLTSVSVPKYEVSLSLKLNDYFRNLGCTSMFNPSVADFKGIADKNIFVESAMQEARFIVDESGAEGAAVSGMWFGLDVGSNVELPTLILDRPFIFGMREKTTGVILFLGVVNNPKAG